MRVLFVSPRECWPPNSGAKLRDYHFAKGLSNGCELTYLFFGSGGSATELAANLPQAVQVRAVASPKKYTPGKIVRGLIGGRPLPVENYTSAGMRGQIEALIASRDFDLVHLDSMHLAAYVPLIQRKAPHSRMVLDWHNIESEAMARYAAGAHSPARRVYARVTTKRLERLETSLLRSCFGHVVCSERERSVLLNRNSSAQVKVAENGVDTKFYACQDAFRSGKRVVFVGQMSYHANADGILWFVREVWPAVRSRFPEFSLSIVGSSPGPDVRSLGSEPGIEVTGTVPDVRPYYHGAFAAIVPLLTGGGTRLKILEAMAAGTPVISTPLGAEGLQVADRSELLLASDARSWVRAFERLLDSGEREQLVSRARDLAVTQYDWEIIGKKLVATYRDWASGDLF